MLSQLELNESLSVIVYGHYKRRDTDIDSINLNFESSIPYLKLEVKQANIEEETNLPITWNNGKFKLKVTITKTRELMRDVEMKPKDLGGIITCRGRAFRMVTA